MKLRYMIIGAGGVGGPVGAYLSKSGADTTLIARGKHLAVLQEHGLTLVSGENERESIPVKAIDMDGFLAAREQGAPRPDVIFVCVKGYSLADTVPFIRKAAGRDTVVIPVLNIYGTGPCPARRSCLSCSSRTAASTFRPTGLRRASFRSTVRSAV